MEGFLNFCKGIGFSTIFSIIAFSLGFLAEYLRGRIPLFPSLLTGLMYISFFLSIPTSLLAAVFSGLAAMKTRKKADECVRFTRDAFIKKIQLENDPNGTRDDIDELNSWVFRRCRELSMDERDLLDPNSYSNLFVDYSDLQDEYLRRL